MIGPLTHGLSPRGGEGRQRQKGATPLPQLVGLYPCLPLDTGVAQAFSPEGAPYHSPGQRSCEKIGLQVLVTLCFQWLTLWINS
jgi:hypothetical protein